MLKERGIQKKMQHISAPYNTTIILKKMEIHKKGAAYIRPIQQDNHAQGEGNTKKDAAYIHPIQQDNHAHGEGNTKKDATYIRPIQQDNSTRKGENI